MYKKIEKSLKKWEGSVKEYRERWRKRVAYWGEVLGKTNKTGKAYVRVERRAAASKAKSEFRALNNQWITAMLKSYKNKVGSEEYTKFYPQVLPLGAKVLAFYQEKSKYYKAKCDAMKSKRSKAYGVAYRYYTAYENRIKRYYWQMLWFDKKMMTRFRKGTPEMKAQHAQKLVDSSALKAQYLLLRKDAKARMGQVRDRSAEWNSYQKMMSSTKTRVKRLRGRKRNRARARVHYWLHRIRRAQVGGANQKKYLQKLDARYKYVLSKYEDRTKSWKARTEAARFGSFTWKKMSLNYYRYMRKQAAWIRWRGRFFKKLRRMFKSDTPEYKEYTKEYDDHMAAGKKLKDDFLVEAQGWVSKLKDTDDGKKYWLRWTKRVSERYDRYRVAVKDLRDKELAFWKMRKASYKDENFRAAYTAMKVARIVCKLN